MTGWGRSAGGYVFHWLREGFPVCGSNVRPAVIEDSVQDVYKCRYCLKALEEFRRAL